MDFGELQGAAAANGPFITAVAIFLIAWFSIVAVTGWLAVRRNREGGLWAAFALFFGPIALLALLLRAPSKKKPALSPLWEKLELEDHVATEHHQARADLGEGGSTL